MTKLVKKSNTDSGMPAKLPIKGNSPATPSMYLSTRNVTTPRATTVPSSKEPGKRISNTMQIALASATSSSVSYLSSTPASTPAPSLDLNKSTKTKSLNLYPQSKSVHYWAARALTAETLLAAGTEHSENLQNVTVSQETKRATEITQLTKLYDERLAKLEKLLVTLLGVLFTITFITFFSRLDLNAEAYLSTQKSDQKDCATQSLRKQSGRGLVVRPEEGRPKRQVGHHKHFTFTVNFAPTLVASPSIKLKT